MAPSSMYLQELNQLWLLLEGEEPYPRYLHMLFEAAT